MEAKIHENKCFFKRSPNKINVMMIIVTNITLNIYKKLKFIILSFFR